MALGMGEEGLVAAVGRLHRSAPAQGGQRQVDLAGDVLTAAERTAHPGQLQPHRVLS